MLNASLNITEIQLKKLQFICAAVLLAACANFASAQEMLTPEKKADIERFLDTTNALALASQMSSGMVGALANAIKAKNPGVPKELLDSLPDIVGSVVDDNLPAFKVLVIALYNRHFTHDEIKQMIAFYSTDLGKKTIQVMPSLMRESIMAGQQWGQSLGPEIERRIRVRFKKAGVEL